MRNTIKNLSMLFFIAIFVLVGCGGGSSSSSSGDSSDNTVPSDDISYQISGTAATGKPIAFGTVTLKDSTGVSVNTVTDANGDFSFDLVGNSPPPYMLRVVPDVPGGIPLYSYTQNMAGTTPTTINITPLTNLIVYEALGRDDLESVFNSGDFSKLTVSAIDSAHDMVRANFSSQLTDNGVNPADINLLSTSFVADSSGVDGVMDEVHVSLLGPNAYINDSGGLCVTYGSNLSGVTIAIDGMASMHFPNFVADDFSLANPFSDLPIDLGYVRSHLDDSCVLGIDDSLYQFIWDRDPDNTRNAVNALKITLRLASQRNKSPINIVAHSWGTVVAYIALTELANSDNTSDQSIIVKNFITIGSPIQCLAGGCIKSLLMQNKIPPEFRGVAIQNPGNVSKWINYWGADDPISKSISAADNNQYVQCTGRISDPKEVPDIHWCNINSGSVVVDLIRDLDNHSKQYFTRIPGSATEPPVLAEVRSLINFSRADSNPLPSVVEPPSLATPTPPSDFTLTAGIPYCDTREPAGPAIELSWAASTNAINYRVYRNNKAIGVNLDSGQHSFINELGLVAGESYEFKVMALNADGTTWSNTYSASIPSDVCASNQTVTIPATPTGTSPGTTYSRGPATSSTTVSLSWSSVSGATYYDLGVRDIATGALVVNTTLSGTSYSANLVASKQYRWNVAACNSAGCSSFTAPLYFQTPSAQGTPAINSLSFTSVPADSTPRTLTIYGSNFATGNVVKYRWLNPVGSNTATASVSSSSQLSASFNPGSVTDTIYVKVCRSSTSTECSGERSITVTAPTLAPAIPTSTSPGTTYSPGPTTSSTTVSLSWSSVSGATYYDLGVRDIATGTLVVNTTLSGTSYSANLVAGKQYRWNVAACNSAGCSSYTTALYFQTPGARVTMPATPTGTSPGTTYSPGPTTSSATVSLSWLSVSGATYYDLGVRDIATGALVVNTTLSGTSYSANLVAGKQYRWNVAACNSAGCSNFTTPMYFQTPNATIILAVNGINSSYSTTTTPYQPVINLTGSGFNSITQISWSCIMPSGSSCVGSPYVWTSVNWSGKFVQTSDTTGWVSPVLLESSDPVGTYSWSVTFSGAGQSMTRYFAVTRN